MTVANHTTRCVQLRSPSVTVRGKASGARGPLGGDDAPGLYPLRTSDLKVESPTMRGWIPNADAYPPVRLSVSDLFSVRVVSRMSTV